MDSDDAWGPAITSTGEIVRDDAVFRDYPEARSVATSALRLWPERKWSQDRLVCFAAERILLTSCFVPVDLDKGRLFINQSYAQIRRDFPLRFQHDGGRYALTSRPVLRPGPHVIIGGPLEGTWYHWLINWCPRLLLLRRFRPDLFDDPEVTFVLHPTALREPYAAVMATFGIPPERILAADPAQDYLFERAYLVSFLDEEKLYPEVIRAFAAALVRAWGLEEASPHPGVFASRQKLWPPKRRIDNFETVEPVFARFGITVASLGDLAAREQARLFRGADIVVGAHGSDLANLIFCRPGTPVIVFESQHSIDLSLHVGLQHLCEVMDLDYQYLLTPAADHPGGDAAPTPVSYHDYIVDADFLAAVLCDNTKPEGGERLLRRGAVDYAALSRFEGDALILACYRLLLGKPVDQGGLDHYRYRLHAQNASKAEIITEIGTSPEGRRRGIAVIGLPGDANGSTPSD